MDITIDRMEAGELNGDKELDGRGLIRVIGTVDGKKADVVFPCLDVRAAHQILASDDARVKLAYLARAELHALGGPDKDQHTPPTSPRLLAARKTAF